MKILKVMVILIAVLFVVCLFLNHNALLIGDPDYAVITYSYGDVYFWEELYGEEVDAIEKILNGKWQHSDYPACDFSEEISITISGYTFALAQDASGVVKNCTTGKYIYLSDSEQDVLEALFTSRGGRFPCI